MNAIHSSSLPVGVTPLASRNRIVLAKATRLLPSTNAWFIARLSHSAAASSITPA